jgi:hypothetical protein
MASFFYQDDIQAGRTAGEKHLTAVHTPKASAWSDSASGASSIERRAQVAPPDLFARSPSTVGAWLSRAWTWLWDMDEAPRKPAPTTGLAKARNEFHSAIWDLQSLKANQLRDQITQSRSLRELWHLRADVFKLISMHRGQAEAQIRVDVLDSHFPVRSSQRTAGRARKVTAW